MLRYNVLVVIGRCGRDMTCEIRESRPGADRPLTCQLVNCPRAVVWFFFCLAITRERVCSDIQLVDVAESDGR